jgi:hypothetical protein
MRKCANISPYMRRPLVIFDFAVAPILNFLIYEENLIFFFVSVQYVLKAGCVCLKTGLFVCPFLGSVQWPVCNVH